MIPKSMQIFYDAHGQLTPVLTSVLLEIQTHLCFMVALVT